MLESPSKLKRYCMYEVVFVNSARRMCMTRAWVIPMTTWQVPRRCFKVIHLLTSMIVFCRKKSSLQNYHKSLILNLQLTDIETVQIWTLEWFKGSFSIFWKFKISKFKLKIIINSFELKKYKMGTNIFLKCNISIGILLISYSDLIFFMFRICLLVVLPIIFE